MKLKNLDNNPSDAHQVWNLQETALLRGGLKLTHLRLLVMIEELGQVSLAAEAMNITQPAASRLLTEMEAIMRCTLCQRASRGVRLTQYGKALAKRGRKILLELHDADREISQLKLGNGGTVYLGAVSAPSVSLVVPAVNKAMEMFPGIEINVDVDNSNVLIRDLLASRVDFIIGRIPDDVHPAPFKLHEIGIEKACLLVRNGHPLMDTDAVSLKDMAGYTWIFQPEGTLMRRAIEDLYLKMKIPTPSNVINTPSIILGLALLRNSDAIMPISQDMASFVASQSSDMGSIGRLATDFELIVRPYGLITMRDRLLTPSAQLLYDLVMSEADKMMNSPAQP